MIRAALVVAAVFVHLAVANAVAPGLLTDYHLGTRVASKLLAAAGALWAVGVLRRGDYMRRFWGPLAAAYALLTLAEVPISSALAGGVPARATALRAALVVTGNLLAVVASAVLAYTYRAAGLGLRTSGRVVLAWVAFAAVSAAIVGPGFVRDVRDAFSGGGTESWASATGGLCDATTFVLLVPVLRFAIRLQGGKLAMPWWAFSAASLCWLLFDATAPIAALAGGLQVNQASEGFRMAACLLTCLAGWYQRDLVAEVQVQASAAAAPGAP